MTDWAAVSQQIEFALELAKPPVSVRFADCAPVGIEPPASPVPAGCSFWELGTSTSIATKAVHHRHCSIGVYTHNLANAPVTQQPELETALSAMQGLDYVRPSEVEALPIMPTSSQYVLYGPLRDATQRPALALLFARASQGLIITEALSRVDGGFPIAMGRPACALIPQVINSARSAASLGCCGARGYLDSLSDDVALWGLHGDKLEAYAKEIATLAKANAVLTQFHQTRRVAIESGETPAVGESLQKLN